MTGPGPGTDAKPRPETLVFSAKDASPKLPALPERDPLRLAGLCLDPPEPPEPPEPLPTVRGSYAPSSPLGGDDPAEPEDEGDCPRAPRRPPKGARASPPFMLCCAPFTGNTSAGSLPNPSRALPSAPNRRSVVMQSTLIALPPLAAQCKAEARSSSSLRKFGSAPAFNK